ncbi:MAG: radical SAM protein [Acidobacteria bacterium]|nr:radical SAM protein [Acidobacteriota bacterium]
MIRKNLTIQYDILADWLINAYCNYACEYCPQVRTKSHRKKSAGRTDIDAMADFFDSTNLTWLIHMSGGEPFLHPEFVSLCRLLTKNHYISVNSNISLKALDAFMRSMDPARVAFIHASLHYYERIKRQSLSGFLHAMHETKAAGFPAYVTQVFYPPLVEEFGEIFSYFHRNGIIVHPKIFRGFYRGRLYPQEYSERDRRVFAEFYDRASSMDELPATHINPDHDIKSLQGFLSFKGSSCLAGNRYVRIDYEGNIYRCSMAGSAIGNIFQKKFARFAGAEICPYRICPCSYFGLEFADGQPKTVKIGPLVKRLIKLKQDMFAQIHRI